MLGASFFTTAGRLSRVASQNMKNTEAQNNTMLMVTILAANVMAGVKAQGETSAISSFTCHPNRPADRIYPINPITQEKVAATPNNATIPRTEIPPHWMGPSNRRSPSTAND